MGADIPPRSGGIAWPIGPAFQPLPVMPLPANIQIMNGACARLPRSLSLPGTAKPSKAKE